MGDIFNNFWCVKWFVKKILTTHENISQYDMMTWRERKKKLKWDEKSNH